MENPGMKEDRLGPDLRADEWMDVKKQFLGTLPPFNTLKETESAEIAATLAWKRLPPGEWVIRQNTPGEFFFIIKSGLVKACLLDEDGKETVLGFLGEGDCFGEIALLTGGPTTANILTVEETLGLLQTKEAFLRMVQAYPVFYPYFNQLLTQRMRLIYKELLSENPGVAQVEPFLYRKQVRDMATPLASLSRSGTTIREAALEILERKWNAAIVIDDRQRPLGAVRLRKVLKSLLTDGVSPQAPVETLLEGDIHSISGESYFFDALHQMIKYQTNELIVLDGEKAIGTLTGFDLLRFRGREVLSLTRNIEEAESLGQINAMRKEVEKVLRALMADGALASHACKIVSEFNDKMVRRVIRLTERECGPPPSPYAWLGLGSEGRREQTLLTDQDNALVFSAPASEEAVGYFGSLATQVVEGLQQCGIPKCKGGVMASQPKYFGDLDQWKTRASGWVQSPSLQDKELMDTYVFLDFRSVSGDPSLDRALRSHLLNTLKQHPAFLRSLAQPMVSVPVPIGFFKNFIVEKGGKYKNRLNIKLYGLVPIITCVKLLALHHAIAETNTLERIRALNREGVLSKDQAEILEQAFESFLTLKIRNNLNDLEQGKELSNHIDPEELSTRQKQLLKESFWAVSELQKTTKQTFNVEDHDSGWVR